MLLQNTRLDVKVGYSCNNLCRHCVQGNKRRESPDKDTPTVKKILSDSFAEGLKEVVFTGGEPTIRKDLPELVRFAKDLGFENIQIQTNGRMFASKSFTETMVDAGMTQLSPALNGHTEEIHDYLSRVPGSWRQTVSGMINVSEYDVSIVTNSVVSKPNYRFLANLAEVLVKLGVSQYQLAFPHPAGRSYQNFDSIVPYKSLAVPFIHRGLDVGLDAGIPVMTEALPYCHMDGYERQVGELFSPSGTVYDLTMQRDFKKWRVTMGKWKGEKCRDCCFFRICEGPWKEYVEKRGDSEFIPVHGKEDVAESIFNEFFR
jgi:radical SAM protein with 4Fe4S-binding SPASM domain